MQTFLPFPDFKASAEALDYRRLGKQRVEAFQLLIAIDDQWALEERARKGLTTITNGWRNHPAAVMWRGYNQALRLYMNIMIQEWIRRGYRNTMSLATIEEITMPHWLQNEEFHASHRANLLRKNTEF